MRSHSTREVTRWLGTTRLRLPREERAEVVASLRESGLSSAISNVVGAEAEWGKKGTHSAPVFPARTGSQATTAICRCGGGVVGGAARPLEVHRATPNPSHTTASLRLCGRFPRGAG